LAAGSQWLNVGRSKSEIVQTSWQQVTDPNRTKWWLLNQSISLQGTWSASAEHQQFDTEVLKLAQAQRMNTDIRRAIFCTIMSSEDYLDAFEKLLKLNLKGSQDREIIFVLMHCCARVCVVQATRTTTTLLAWRLVQLTPTAQPMHAQEKTFNPYYAYLLVKLCSFSANHKMTVNIKLKDQFETMDDLKYVDSALID
jgi:nucleolar MIF4G domain-containing protein 1